MRRKQFLACLASYFIVSLAGCDGNANAPPPPPSATVDSITLSPSSVTLAGDGSQQFTATISASNSAALKWSLLENAKIDENVVFVGMISDAGLFTALRIPGTYHVVATSQVDTTKSAMATVNVVVHSGFTYVGNMNQPRAAHTATLLPNGKVLFVGGGYFDIDDRLQAIQAAELFDPAIGTFEAIAVKPVVAREFQTATLLSAGMALLRMPLRNCTTPQRKHCNRSQRCSRLVPRTLRLCSSTAGCCWQAALPGKWRSRARKSTIHKPAHSAQLATWRRLDLATRQPCFKTVRCSSLEAETTTRRT
jgi:hypothetical protein